MKVASVRVSSWRQFLTASARFTKSPDAQWIFRGHADNSKPLATTLERAAERFSVPRSELPYREGGLIRRFQRQLHHYSRDVPKRGNYIEWLAIMQHYGAPTRLLDWTRSVFAACFFAIDRSSVEAAVWALNEDALATAFKRHVPKDLHYLAEPGQNVETLQQFKDAFSRRPPLPFVIPMNPYRLNERLTIQQGLFLCPGDITQDFVANLKAVIGAKPSKNVLFRIILSPDRGFRREIVQHLNRMNMNAVSLYPGLDGFGRYLWHLVALPARTHPPDPRFRDPLALPRTLRRLTRR